MFSGSVLSRLAGEERRAIMARGAANALIGRCRSLGGDELIPFADHVVILVHDRVPAGDVAHAIVVGAAVARCPGLFEQRTVGSFDVLFGGLALHPIGPFIGLHIGLGGGQHSRIIALAVEIGARPPRQVPVDELVDHVGLLRRHALGHAESRRPGAIAIFQPLKEGYRSWASGFCMSKGVTPKQADMVYEFVNWYLSGWAGAYLNRQGYYSAVLSTAKANMEPYEWAYWMEGKPAEQDIKGPDGSLLEKAGATRDGGSYDDRMGNVACWNAVMDENDYMVRKWNEFIAS